MCLSCFSREGSFSSSFVMTYQLTSWVPFQFCAWKQVVGGLSKTYYVLSTLLLVSSCVHSQIFFFLPECSLSWSSFLFGWSNRSLILFLFCWLTVPFLFFLGTSGRGFALSGSAVTAPCSSSALQISTLSASSALPSELRKKDRQRALLPCYFCHCKADLGLCGVEDTNHPK